MICRVASTGETGVMGEMIGMALYLTDDVSTLGSGAKRPVAAQLMAAEPRTVEVSR
jgi:hypothetical protein